MGTREPRYRVNRSSARRGLVTVRKTKFSMTVPKAMEEALHEEREQRKLNTLQETIRSILGEYFRAQDDYGGSRASLKR